MIWFWVCDLVLGLFLLVTLVVGGWGCGWWLLWQWMWAVAAGGSGCGQQQGLSFAVGFGGGYGSGCGCGCGQWWLVVVGWVGFCNGFKFVSQWVSVDFSGQWQWQWVGFLMVVVAWVFWWWQWLVVALSGGLGVFVWGKRYIEKEKGRDAENKKRIKKE